MERKCEKRLRDHMPLLRNLRDPMITFEGVLSYSNMAWGVLFTLVQCLKY